MDNENVKCACQGATLTRFVQPIILLLLSESPDHGYELVQKISHTALWQDTSPDAGGVYRVLRDMERRGLICSSFSTDSKVGMGKRVFAITDAGRSCMANWAETLERYCCGINQMVDQRDGQWMGMLCYLYLGIRPSEGRGLRFRDFRPFGSHPKNWYCNICRTATETGEHKAKGKTKNYIRRVPVHPELQSILEMYKIELNKQLGGSEKELDDLPVICVGTKYREPCTSLQLMRFVKGQLGDIVEEDELETLFMLSYTDEPTEEIHESNGDDSANKDISTRILRRNFITKAYAETTLGEEEIRAIVGHRQDRVKVDYSEETVYSWLKSISHRLICPEYHADMDTTIDDTKSQQQISAGTHKVTLAKEIGEGGLHLEITMLGESEGGDLRIAVQGGIPQELKVVKLERSYFLDTRKDRGERIVTDCTHWLLEHFE